MKTVWYFCSCLFQCHDQCLVVRICIIMHYILKPVFNATNLLYKTEGGRGEIVWCLTFFWTSAITNVCNQGTWPKCLPYRKGTLCLGICFNSCWSLTHGMKWGIGVGQNRCHKGTKRPGVAGHLRVCHHTTGSYSHLAMANVAHWNMGQVYNLSTVTTLFVSPLYTGSTV